MLAQFVADFLGFWDWDQLTEDKDQLTKDQSAKYASVVYQHLSNCQDYLTYNSDELSVFPRRIAFRRSIDWLRRASIYGIQKKREVSPNAVPGHVWNVRRFGNSLAKYLQGEKGLSEDKAAAILLSIALDAIHKSVLMVSCTRDFCVICTEAFQFTEVLNYLLHNRSKDNSYLWTEVKAIAQSDGIKKLSGYILEAQRLACHVPLVRQTTDDVAELRKTKKSGDSPIPKGTVLLIDMVSLLFSMAVQLNSFFFFLFRHLEFPTDPS